MLSKFSIKMADTIKANRLSFHLSDEMEQYASWAPRCKGCREKNKMWLSPPMRIAAFCDFATIILQPVKCLKMLLWVSVHSQQVKIIQIKCISKQFGIFLPANTRIPLFQEILARNFYQKPRTNLWLPGVPASPCTTSTMPNGESQPG